MEPTEEEEEEEEEEEGGGGRSVGLRGLFLGVRQTPCRSLRRRLVSGA